MKTLRVHDPRKPEKVRKLSVEEINEAGGRGLQTSLDEHFREEE